MLTGRNEQAAILARFVIRLAVVGLVMYGAWALFGGGWKQRQLDQQIANAYAFVIDHDEVSSQLPCFCGCDRREGHASLDSCFVSRRDSEGRMVARDRHAETCKVCVDVALDASRMLDRGATLADIKAAVNAKYRSMSAHED